VSNGTTTAWYDVETTFENVLAALRLGEGDVDGERIRQKIPAAAALIDQYLDRSDPLPGPPPPPEIQEGLEQATIVLYRRKDTPSNLFPSGDPATRYDAADPLGELYATLLPWKQGWGIG